MLHVLLLILKILGIILACILGLILLIILLVLLVPIRYGGDASYYDKKPVFNVKVGWIPGLVSVILSNATGKIGLKIKVCGFAIKDTLRPEKPKKEKKSKDKAAEELSEELLEELEEASSEKEQLQETKTEAVVSSEDQSEEKSKEEKTKKEKPEKEKSKKEKPKKEKPKKEKSKKEKAKKEKSKKEKIKKGESEDAAPKEKISLGERIEKLYDKVSETVKAKLQMVSEKTKALQDKKDQVTDIFLSDKGKATMIRVKRLVFKLLYHIRPRKIRGNLLYGAGDGYQTAKLLSILATLYPIYTPAFKVTPDFNQKIIEGQISFKGHITLGYIAILGLKGFFDKDLKKMIKDIKNLKG